MNPTIRTGQSGANGSEGTPYAFQTPQLQANQVYQSGSSNFMGGGTTSNNTPRNASLGVWQQSRVNPGYPSQCGLRVALILDWSTSNQSSESPAEGGSRPVHRRAHGHAIVRVDLRVRR